MPSVLLLVAFVVYLQGVGHEKALQNVGQIVSFKFHSSCSRNPSEKLDWFSNAWRDSSLNHAVLPSVERLEICGEDEKREAENSF